MYNIQVLGTFSSLDKAKKYTLDLIAKEDRSNYDCFMEWVDENEYDLLLDTEKDFLEPNDPEVQDVIDVYMNERRSEVEQLMENMERREGFGDKPHTPIQYSFTYGIFSYEFTKVKHHE